MNTTRLSLSWILYAGLALFGVAMVVEWRTCAFGWKMEILNRHTACVDGARVEVPLDYEAVGAE